GKQDGKRRDGAVAALDEAGALEERCRDREASGVDRLRQDQQTDERRERIVLRFESRHAKWRCPAGEARPGTPKQPRQLGGPITRLVEGVAQLARDRGVERSVGHDPILADPQPGAAAFVRDAAEVSTARTTGA